MTHEDLAKIAHDTDRAFPFLLLLLRSRDLYSARLAPRSIAILVPVLFHLNDQQITFYSFVSGSFSRPVRGLTLV